MANITLFNENLTPWRGLIDLQRHMDRLFDDVWTPQSRGLAKESITFQPTGEFEESEDHYLMSFDLPGVSKKDIQIEINGNQLVISGERKQERSTKSLSERSYGRFQRLLTLPADVDAEHIEADYEDGVLKLALPKAESAKPRQIKIGETKGSFFSRLVGGKEPPKESGKSASEKAA